MSVVPIYIKKKDGTTIILPTSPCYIWSWAVDKIKETNNRANHGANT